MHTAAAAGARRNAKESKITLISTISVVLKCDEREGMQKQKWEHGRRSIRRLGCAAAGWSGSINLQQGSHLSLIAGNHSRG